MLCLSLDMPLHAVFSVHSHGSALSNMYICPYDPPIQVQYSRSSIIQTALATEKVFR